MQKFRSTIYFILILSLSGCSQHDFFGMWKTIWSKSAELVTLEARHKVLLEEHEKLRKEYYELEHKYIALLSKEHSQELGEKNLELTGAKDGQSSKSISYEVAEDLSIPARHDLAYTQMKEEDYARAVKTFDSFLKVPEGAFYQTPQNFYQAGIAWFKINNYKRAQENFEAALSRFESIGPQERRNLEQKIDLWMRILNNKRERSPASVHKPEKE